MRTRSTGCHSRKPKQRAAAAATEEWQQEGYAILRQNALRMLIATSPDLHTS